MFFFPQQPKWTPLLNYRETKGRVGKMVRRVRTNSKYLSEMELCISLWTHAQEMKSQRHCQYQIDKKMIPGCRLVWNYLDTCRPEIILQKPIKRRRPVCGKETPNKMKKRFTAVCRQSFRLEKTVERDVTFFFLFSKIHQMVVVTVSNEGAGGIVAKHVHILGVRWTSEFISTLEILGVH